MELITQLCTYVSAIRILAKGYLSNTLIKSKRPQEILTEVKKSLHITNPNYNLVLDKLHLYYDMQFVTFGIDGDMNFVIQFLVFIQPYTQKPLILYQLETVPVPILDQNAKAQLYTHLRVKKPYIALNSETYISLRQQELRSCKRLVMNSIVKSFLLLNTNLVIVVKVQFTSICQQTLSKTTVILTFTSIKLMLLPQS